MQNIPQNFNFNNLSVKDLVEARDMFHVHLINKRNVVATAIGKYLIRHDDIDENGKLKEPLKSDPGKPVSFVQKPARTLDNSMSIDISWPCILVFVKQWEPETALIEQGASNIVPKTIFMPDGRIVPVCTVVAPQDAPEKKTIDISQLRFPETMIGGGFPLLIESQGITHVATAGCVVSDGHTYYALTNKHVAGEKEQIIKSIAGTKEIVVGKSAGMALGKCRFNDMYPGWENNHLLVSCDAGLVEIRDVTEWKTDILGAPHVDEMFDINTMNFGLGLVAEHRKEGGKILDSTAGNVVGYGAVSGELKGEIMALFYRYKTVAGVEYVSDFLIAGRSGKNLEVHYGDSGMVWLLETEDENYQRKLQPVALHWGQHELMQNTRKIGYAYSLSTCLSNVCRGLDVDIVRGWNTETEFSWGESGHYSIGNRASYAVDKDKFPKLAELMHNNAGNISYSDTAILAKDYNKSTNIFTPLVDVPDTVFKSKTRGISRFPNENPNHYCDVDITRESDGKSLLEISKPANGLTVATWKAFYDETGNTSTKSRGLLPFRVKQIFREMVRYLKDDNVDGFVCAAGVLGHYIGDACQPLHGSKFTNGDPDRPETEGVHTAYETTMIDNNRKEILSDLKSIIDSQNTSTDLDNRIPAITSEDAAAAATLHLLEIAMKRISPIDLNNVYYDAVITGTKASGVKALWTEYGKETKGTIARGARYLAKMWEGAWELAGAEQKAAIGTAKISKSKLMAIYNNKETFIKSYTLDQIQHYFDGNG